MVNEPLIIKLAVTKTAATASIFDFDGSIAALQGADELACWRRRYSSVYLAVSHIFPDVPLSSGAFEPLKSGRRPEGTFLDAQYPRPVSGCAAEVSQRIAEAVFSGVGAGACPTWSRPRPPAPAATSRSAAAIPDRGRDYVMYQISGGGYGGNADGDGLANGCSTIGISKLAAGGDHGTGLSRSSSATMRCARLQAAPASIAAASGSPTRSSCCGARRARPS